MKQILFFVWALVLLSSTDASGQSKINEGKITYAISFPDTGSDNSMMEMTMGKEYVIYFKDSNSRVEMQNMAGNLAVISHGSGDSYTLMEMMGEKYALKMTEEDINMYKDMADAGKPTVSLEKGRKKIAGFECKKAVVTYSAQGKKISSEVWYTDEITASPAAFKDKVSGIPGFPLELSYKVKGSSIKMECTAVEKVPVSADKFVVPDDYTVKNMSELMNMMGGQH